MLRMIRTERSVPLVLSPLGLQCLQYDLLCHHLRSEQLHRLLQAETENVRNKVQKTRQTKINGFLRCGWAIIVFEEDGGLYSEPGTLSIIVNQFRSESNYTYLVSIEVLSSTYELYALPL